MTSRTLKDYLAEFVGKPPGSIAIGVIHLPRATEREEGIRALEAALQTPLEHFEGVDGTALIAAGHPTTCVMEPNKKRLSGEIGCLVSHIQAARKALADGKSHLVVFEDDCTVGSGFSLEAVGYFLQRAKLFAEEFSIKGTTDFLLLGTCGCYTWKFLTDGVKATNNFNGSHAYLMSRLMMEKLVGSYDFLSKKGVVAPVDGLIGLILRSQREWILCPEDETGLFVQNRQIPSYVVKEEASLREE